MCVNIVNVVLFMKTSVALKATCDQCCVQGFLKLSLSFTVFESIQVDNSSELMVNMK